MSARFGLRAIAPLRNSSRQQAQNIRFSQRRWASDAAAPVAEAQTQTAFQKFLNSPVGPKTVHFWAPIMKWGVVLAGAADFARPASQLSITQNAALMTTGLIWTRWCFVIKPRNLFLASVNFLLFCVGLTQVSRVLIYQSSQKGTTEGEAAKDLAEKEGGILEKVAEDPVGAAKSAVGAK